MRRKLYHCCRRAKRHLVECGYPACGAETIIRNFKARELHYLVNVYCSPRFDAPHVDGDCHSAPGQSQSASTSRSPDAGCACLRKNGVSDPITPETRTTFICRKSAIPQTGTAKASRCRYSARCAIANLFKDYVPTTGISSSTMAAAVRELLMRMMNPPVISAISVSALNCPSCNRGK